MNYMYIPNELKLIIYNLCDNIYTKILLNKVFKWSFYECNPFENILYKKGPIKINVNCGDRFHNFTIICPFCNNTTILKLYPGSLGNPILNCEDCNSKSFLQDFGVNRHCNTIKQFNSDLLLIESIFINECHCDDEFDICVCETIPITPTFNISTLNSDYNYFKAKDIKTGKYLTVFWEEDLFVS